MAKNVCTYLNSVVKAPWCDEVEKKLILNQFLHYVKYEAKNLTTIWRVAHDGIQMVCRYDLQNATSEKHSEMKDDGKPSKAVKRDGSLSKPIATATPTGNQWLARDNFLAQTDC